MKAKTALIALVVVGGLGAAAVYGARFYKDSHRKPVEVVPVSSVNSSSMDFYFSDEYNYGMLVARDSQTVSLDTSKQLTDVYVKTGDKVKVGDKLMAYDTTLVQLQKEMQELTIQMLEINLKTQEKTLAKLQKGDATASLEASVDENTGSGNEEADTDIQEPQTSTLLSSSGSSDGATDDDEPSRSESSLLGDGTESGEIISSEDEAGTDTGEQTADQTGNIDMLFDDEEDVSDDSGDDSGSSTTPEQTETSAGEVKSAIETFFYLIGMMRQQDIENLNESYISNALDVFRSSLGKVVSSDSISPDMMGQTTKVDIYTLSETVKKEAEETDPNLVSQLYQGYAYVLTYDFLNNLNKLKALMPAGKEPASLTDKEMESLYDQLHRTVEAFYRFSRNKESGEMSNNLGDLGDLLREELIDPEISSDSLLVALIARSNSTEIFDETEAESETEETTEFDFDIQLGVGDVATPDTEKVDLSYEIFLQEMEIRDTKLKIREEQLKLDEYNRAIEECLVRATVGGIVKDAGTVEEGGSSDAFIVIGGEKGLYLEGTVSELRLGEIHVGDTVTGQDWDTYMPFTAEITEISKYPTSAESFWGDTNTNASNYPFYAYIEDSESFEEGAMCEFSFVSGEKQAGISLPAYFIRTDISGRNFVLIAGNDGKLMKKYVKTGSTGWNGTEIKSGLADTDLIAFPYGYNVEIGAPTKEVTALQGMDTFDMYGIG